MKILVNGEQRQIEAATLAGALEPLDYGASVSRRTSMRRSTLIWSEFLRTARFGFRTNCRTPIVRRCTLAAA
jgi:hypothetical protein